MSCTCKITILKVAKIPVVRIQCTIVYRTSINACKFGVIKKKSTGEIEEMPNDW